MLLDKHIILYQLFLSANKKSGGRIYYIVPENVDLEKAKHIALERLKTQLIADESAQLFPKTMLLPLRIATESQT